MSNLVPSVGSYPELKASWDFIKNNGINPDDVSVSSGKKYWWKCVENNAPDHEWFVAPYARMTTGKPTGCPFCANHRISITNSLATCIPKVALGWHPTKNGNLKPSDVTSRTDKSVWWLCNRNHEFKTSVYNRTVAGTKCPVCIPKGESLSELYPEISQEWDYRKNSNKPDEFYAHSAKKCWWVCSICQYSWEKPIFERTRKDDRQDLGCPRCQDGRHSKDERYIRYELLKFFTILDENIPLLIDGQKYDIDIVIPSIKTIVEYDGSFFHKNKLIKDINKTVMCQTAGWTVIRVRECYGETILDKITSDDIIRTHKMPLKEVVNKLLLFLKNRFNLEIDVKSYLEEPDLINRDNAEKFILEQKLKKQWKKELVTGETSKIDILKLRGRVIELCTSLKLAQPEISKKIKEEFSVDIDRHIIREIVGDQRKNGLLWQKPTIKKKIKERILELAINHQISQVEIAEKIETEFGVILGQNTISKVSVASGINKKTGPLGLSLEIKSIILGLSAEHITYQEISNILLLQHKMEVSKAVIGWVVRKAGYRRRNDRRSNGTTQT